MDETFFFKILMFAVVVSYFMGVVSGILFTHFKPQD